MVLIAPSLLSADFACLGKEVEALTRAGADAIHLDVMDGHFVDNLTFGPVVVEAVRPYTPLPLDAHLMMARPGDFIARFAQAGADAITVHIESGQKTDLLISLIQKAGKKAGISIRPETKTARLIPYLPMIDSVLVMAVDPGFGGQAFQRQALARIAEIKALVGRKKITVAVDGGINPTTAPACLLAGADMLISGSFILKSKNYRKAIAQLREGA